MVSLISTSKAQRQLSDNTRLQRLNLQLTQEELSKRSGVSLATLRKFEQKGLISLESFLKLHAVLGGLERILKATEPQKESFSSIEDVLKTDQKPRRKRGPRK